MHPAEIGVLLLAGLAAGMVNAVVGGGGLLTFPVLLALGFTPITANVTNTVGVLAGSVAAAWSYRPEMVGNWRRLSPSILVSALGSAIGAIVLISLPASSFKAAAPSLIIIACVLILLQPWLTRIIRTKSSHVMRRGFLVLGVFLAGIYGGYFGVAVGILLMALLNLFFTSQLQVAGAAKNVLASVTNGVAALIFVAVGSVLWLPAGLLAVGSIAGGRLGVLIGRRLSPNAYRFILVAMGIVTAIRVSTA